MTDPSALRLPSSPYPGLRPFLAHEEMLMYGRKTQIEDVVQRLGRRVHSSPSDAAPDAPRPATRFVAVLGGSGSGKSSLIRAGVVPYLRQFGIPEAGDLWETVVATPGTNFQPDADGQVHESPITRLARKFEAVLRGPHQPGRCEAIEQTLRRPGGLGLMVAQYGAELNLPEGVRAEKACVLLVIDQFEELFHKTNAGRSDARLLIERVIDHYHQAHNGLGCERCYLAITMRSEHLDDCAGYLGLPEAINSGGYLVSRLGETQLREVIEKPAQRYLRLRQRERQALARQQPPLDLSALPALPSAVAFEDGVVRSLVQAAGQIEHDPDHLPLLQHALARTWAAACAREGLQVSDVPQAITLADLWRAGQADLDPPAPPAEQDNLLRLSLNSWAEHDLLDHPEAEQADVLGLMRRLAYKDLRTGSYNQQRLYVSQHPLGEARLKALLQGRWIDGVDYLYWDDEDPQHVTLKVSHESFIRGWASLRKLADAEAKRLEQFITLLEYTQRWIEKDRADPCLLDQLLLNILDDARLEEAWAPAGDPGEDRESLTWRDWRGWLGQLPRGLPLLSVQRQDLRLYVSRSREVLVQLANRAREQEEDAIRAREEAVKAQAEAREARANAERAKAQTEAAEARARAERLEAQAAADRAQADSLRRRRRRRIGFIALVLGGALGFFATAVLIPVTVRSQHYFMAAGQANEVHASLAREQIGGSLGDLKKLLGAAQRVQRAKSPVEAQDRWTTLTAPLADEVLSWPGLRELNLATLLSDAAGAIEPGVNRQLRQVLTQSVWYTTPPEDTAAIRIEANKRRDNIDCELDGESVTGSLATVRRTLAGTDDDLRGIFIQTLRASQPGNTAQRPMYSARLKRADGQERCTLERPFFLPIEPGAPMPDVVFDGLLGYMLLATDARARGASTGGSASTISVLRLKWDAYDAGGSAVPVGPLAVVSNDPDAAGDLRRQVEEDGIGVAVAAARTPGGRALRVKDRWWRLVSDSAQRIEPPPEPADLQALPQAAETDACGRILQLLRKDYAQQTGDSEAALDLVALTAPPSRGQAKPEHCLIVQHESRARLDQFNLQVFRFPARNDFDAQGELLRTKLVDSFEFGRLRRADEPGRTWLTGRNSASVSPWDGWLMLRISSRTAGQSDRYIGVPWSTEALRRLGEALCLSHLKAEGKSPSPAQCYPAPDDEKSSAPASVAPSKGGQP